MRVIVLCTAALVGVVVGDISRLEPNRLAFVAGLALVGAALANGYAGWRFAALVACAAAVGGWRASLVAADDHAAMLEPYFGLVSRVRGTVVDVPALTSGGSLRLLLEVEAAAPAGRDPPSFRTPPPVGDEPSADRDRSEPVRVRVIGDAAVLSSVAPADVLVLEGRLLPAEGRGPPTLLFPRLVGRQPPQEPPGPAALFIGMRWAAEKGIRHYLPEPQASLATGVLLGGSSGLDADVRLQLQRSGLAHLVAIDGYKQVVVAGALGALAVRLLGARLAALPILLGIAAYTLLTGAHPSAVRAALMVGLATLASLTGRLADPLTSLLLAAVAMAAFDPRILLDIGLQLSLSATLGLVLLWPRLRRRLRTLPSFVAEPAGLTLAVTLATLPVVLSVFQLVSLVSPVAHIVAVPLLPLVLGSTALLALVAPIEALATPVGWLAWLPSTVLLRTIEFFGNLPGAALSTGRLPTLAAICLALGLLAWGLLDLPEAAGLRSVWAQRANRVQVGPAAVCVVACLGAASVLQIVRPDGRLHVHALEAGRGEAVFIRGPTGRTALVVRGKVDATRVTDQVADHLALWEHKLDTLLTLDAAAQAAIEPTLARYPAEQQLDANADTRVDLGGGAVVDVYASGGIGQAEAGVSVSFGEDWLVVAGRPPPTPIGSSLSLPRPGTDYALVSDGRELWTAP